MTSHRQFIIPVLVFGALAPQVWADQDAGLRRIDIDSPQVIIRKDHAGPVEKEKVTYLGVETAPVNRTLGVQLGLPRDTGLVVVNILDKSPAAEALKEDDVLTKLDDQLLVNTQQLGVLVRARKEGDEARLTVIRGGKEITVKAKLAGHEVPKLADNFFFRGRNGGADWKAMMPPEALAGLEELHNLPGMGADEARDVLRMIGREREQGGLLGGPGVHIIDRHGQGSTILDLEKSNISYSDDDGSIEIKSDDGQRNVTVKGAKGEVTFTGPISTPEQRDKLPAEVKKRLGKLDSDGFRFEAGEDFKPETVPLPPAKTKISGEPRRAVVLPSGQPF